MKEQPEALWLADALEGRATRAWTREEVAAKLRRLHAVEEEWARLSQDEGKAEREIEHLHEENRKLKTVMVAAAEEISAHWDAHCDSEGYGPANLMRRLEDGIASEYGYTAGAFARLRAVNAELLHALHCIRLAAQDSGSTREGMGLYARAAIAKAEGEQA
jgi:hypothetical protein